MLVSAEILTTAIGFAAFLVALASGFGWMIRRSDAQFQRLSNEIADVRKDLTGEISSVRNELVEVKIAVARLEGPPRHLISAR